MARSKGKGGKSSSVGNFIQGSEITNITASDNGSEGRADDDGKVTISWTPASNLRNTPTGYKVYVDGVLKATVPYGTNSTSVTGLTTGSTKNISVVPYDAYIDQSPAASTATVTAVPKTPTAPTATNVGSGRGYNNGRADVSFTAPADNGSAITSYTVTSTPGGYTATGSSSPISVTGLQSNTAYTFKVKATNANGTSAESPASNSITATTVPDTVGTPSVSTVAIGGASAQGSANTATDTVSWSAPANGGSAITNYHWTSSDGKSGDTTNTSVDVSQESGTAQTYTVYATNTNGNGGSGTSGSITSAFSFTPFGFTPFGFTPFGAFGFTPFGAFGFTPFGAFGFTPFGAFFFFSYWQFASFGFAPGPGWSDSININTMVRTKDGLKAAKDVVVGDKLLALNIIDGADIDWLHWASGDISLSNENVVETTVISVDTSSTGEFIYIDGDVFAKTHYILTKKDNVIQFVKVSDIDTSYQRYSYDNGGFVDIEIVEEIFAVMDKVSINCEPYDNFFTEKMLAFDRRDV